MGYASLICPCASCGAMITCNPNTVPSIRVGGVGEKQPICEACFNRWNEIHRTSKGLDSIPLAKDAYVGCPEEEL